MATPFPGWDEQAYLRANPDVAAAVSAGQLGSALQHYQSFGQSEGRNPGGTPLPTARATDSGSPGGPRNFNTQYDPSTLRFEPGLNAWDYFVTPEGYRIPSYEVLQAHPGMETSMFPKMDYSAPTFVPAAKPAPAGGAGGAGGGLGSMATNPLMAALLPQLAQMFGGGAGGSMIPAQGAAPMANAIAGGGSGFLRPQAQTMFPTVPGMFK